MKNPFPSPVTITDTNRYGDQYIGCPLAAISITVCRGPQDDMNPEEVAEFLVHAINQHEKLVAMLGKQQRIMMTFCGCCGGNPCRPDCELDALLKEEQT